MSKKILIIFSTVGGNTELVVDAVANLLAPDIFEITKKRPEISDPQEIKNFDLTILASPTYNQGTLEDNFKNFIKAFIKEDFSNQKFAIIGLGDSKYYPEYLTESASILEDIIKKTGGQMVVPALRIGVNPIKMLDKLVPKWVDKLKLADI
jgi:flavodoxin I